MTTSLRYGRSARRAPLYATAPGDMVWIKGRTFLMGSDAHYPEEGPAREVSVGGFWIDRDPVTNASFAAFVEETGYVTVAEEPNDASRYPGGIREMLRPGSLVFVQPQTTVSLRDTSTWWRYVIGAQWRHPEGPRSSIHGREQHPVVHIAYRDAVAFAAWAGKSLPTEAEWEVACRGGIEGAPFAWGHELTPGGMCMANYWQGRFPHENLRIDGWEGTSPVGAFPANGYGVRDMIGNVWEWTTDWFETHNTFGRTPCCVPRNPRGGFERISSDPSVPAIHTPRKVLKGGSFLCAPSHCQRYRPAARHAQPIDTATSHVGFRCAARPVE